MIKKIQIKTFNITIPINTQKQVISQLRGFESEASITSSLSPDRINVRARITHISFMDTSGNDTEVLTKQQRSHRGV